MTHNFKERYFLKCGHLKSNFIKLTFKLLDERLSCPSNISLILLDNFKASSLREIWFLHCADSGGQHLFYTLHFSLHICMNYSGIPYKHVYVCHSHLFFFLTIQKKKVATTKITFNIHITFIKGWPSQNKS